MGLAAKILDWFRRRQEAERLARAEADNLIRAYGDLAYRIARRYEVDIKSSSGTTYEGRSPDHWRRVARLIAKGTDAP